MSHASPQRDSIATPPATAAWPAVGVLSDAWVRRLTWAFVALGVAVRLNRYLLNFPLWCDEAYVARNFLDWGYVDLLQPLHYQQICPPLFLWAELSLVKWLGFNEWALRLFPLVCGLASLFLFRHVAARLFSGLSQVLAVAVFAVSYSPVRHAAEVKPYASDLLASLVLIALAVEWRRRPDRSRWLWALAAVAPAMLALSYPAVFVAGGVSVALLVGMRCKSARRRDWVAWIAYNMVVAGTFLALFLGVTRGQYEASVELAHVDNFWNGRFPPLTEPLRLLVWLANQHTGRMFGYPVGGDRGASIASFACVLAGVLVLARRRERMLLALLLGPFALNLLAAALQRYPYGGSARITQHVAPLVCLLMGLGAAALVALVRDAARQRRLALGACGGLAVFALGFLVFDVVHPYKQPYDALVRDFARYVWREKAVDAELLCVSRDLRESFAVEALQATGPAQAQYLCNQAIYSRRRHWHDPLPPPASIASSHPLRCVLQRRPDDARFDQPLEAWLAQMQAQYDWIGYEKHDFRSYYRRREQGQERIEIFEFVPKGRASAEVASRPRLITGTPATLR